MATASSELQLVLTAKDEASKKLNGLNSSISGLGKSIGTVAKVAGAALVAAGSAATAFGVTAVKEYGKFATIQLQLEKVLNNTQKATKEQVAVLIEQAQALEKIGVVSDDVTMSFQARLAQYDYEIGTIEKLTPAILDMMVAEKGANATIEDGIYYAEGFGKAMQGQFDILRKRGFIISEETENIMKFGTEAQRVEEVFKLLGKTYAGVNEAMRNTPEGSIKALEMAWDNVKKNIGFVLVEQLHLNEVLNNLADKVNKFAESDFAGYWQTISTAIQSAWQWVKDLFSETELIGQAWIILKGYFLLFKDEMVKSWNEIMVAIQPIKPELILVAKVLGGLLLAAIVVIVGGFLLLLTTFVKITTSMIKAWSSSVQSFKATWQAFKDFFNGVVEVIRGNWNNGLESMKKGIAGFVSIAKTQIASFVNFFIAGINKVIEGMNAIPGVDIGSIGKFSFKQFGGGVEKGSPYIVGEHRPEVFVPSQSGNIRQLDQVGKTVTVNFNNVSVRNDNDLEMIISQVKKVLNREQELNQLGAY